MTAKAVKKHVLALIRLSIPEMGLQHYSAANSFSEALLITGLVRWCCCRISLLMLISWPINVVDGIFLFSSAQKSRHTVAVVAWQSYDTRDLEYEYVEDHAAVAKYGIIKKDIKAIGCYSQGSSSFGKWTLLSEQNLTETCEFAVAIGGTILRPGMVVDIADPMRGGTRRSRRVSSRQQPSSH